MAAYDTKVLKAVKELGLASREAVQRKLKNWEAEKTTASLLRLWKDRKIQRVIQCGGRAELYEVFQPDYS